VNPDADINVVTVTRDGTARIYGHERPEEAGGGRSRLETRLFSSYGIAKLWADEYEANQRAARAVRPGRR
jgi:hypothetical protein